MKLNILLSFFLIASVVNAEVIERVVATVNGELILKSDIEDFKKQLNKTQMIDELILNGNSIDAIKANSNLQLDVLINQKLIASEVKKLNLGVTQERVDQEILNLAKANNLKKEELLAEVKKQGISSSEYQDFVKNNIERQSLIEQEITSKIIVTDEDVLAFYLSKSPNKANQVTEYKLSHILFLNKKDPEGAKKRAENALALLKSGQPFEKMVEHYSEDSSISDGGLLGTFKSGEFIKEIEEQVTKLNVGEITGVVQTKMGLHIVKVLSKKTITDPQFEKEKEQLRAQIRETTFRKQFAIWLENKKEEAYIVYNK